jgi:choline dehydrogenase-like flavoprotein
VMKTAEPELIQCDVAVIGSGMGGGMVARALAERGREVYVFERGERLPREDANWDVSFVFGKNAYKNSEKWLDKRGRAFKPGVHYYVGGNTKVYGASLPRFRESDFKPYMTKDGISPEWPFGYADLEPYYLQAEHALEVHGNPVEDPTEPWRSGPYPYPAVPHEPATQALADSFKKQRLSPYVMPMGVDVKVGGSCILCKTCDGFPCKLGAKRDAETNGIDVALQHGAKLFERTHIEKLEHDVSGKRVIAAIGTLMNRPVRIEANKFVLSAGAANSAAILLRSKSSHYPAGLANSSGLVGKNWMVHNATFVIALNPFKKNATRFQKTLGVNDWYLNEDPRKRLGNVQMLGKVQGEMVRGIYPIIPKWLANFITSHSVDLYLESEDVPSLENRVTLDDRGNICIHWKPTNLSAHKALIRKTRLALWRAGYPFVFTKTMGIETNSHMCGTIVAGNNSDSSVLNRFCRTHDLENLYVVDASFFPSSAAMNPALTIAAQAFRVVDKGGL